MSANALARTDDGGKMEAALIKAVGWDRVPPEQRALALHICERYDLDPMLRHVVMVEGKPYITRDGLLHVAHRSGVFDGIEVTDPVERDGYWHVRATVYRKDISRGIAYPGRYPVKGKNQMYSPEMGIKVAEVMALRRAFDVSAPVIEERWDIDTGEAIEPRKPVSLAEKAAAGRARIEARVEPQDAPDTGSVVSAEGARSTVAPAETGDAEPQAGAVAPTAAPADIVDAEVVESVQCDVFHDGFGRCRREAGHPGNHAAASKETWAP